MRKKPLKYKNIKVEYQGIIFDSGHECEYYKKLQILERKGIIENLRTQVKFVLIPSQKLTNGKRERPVTYIADFVYFENGKQYVVDTKGYKTPYYVLKRKLMKFVYDIEIHEV